MTLLAAQTFRDNAEMIEQCAQLGYLKPEWFTLDPTYGKGNWWTRFRPTVLSMHDKYVLDGVDFTNLPEDDDTYDAAAFDPPYVAKGGRATSGMKDFDAAYGLRLAERTPWALQTAINYGLDELARVVVPRGSVLVKCQNYVSNGRLFLGREHTLQHALDKGFTVTDIVEYVVKAPRPQPPGRQQKHFRRNLSTLLVFKAPKKPE